MLCSLPAPPKSSSSSSSSWLDRLHSLKGFTAPSPASPTPLPPTPPPNPNPNPNPPPPPSHVLGAILSDLFVIPRAAPAPPALPHKRHPCRKQPSPRICLLNSPPSPPTLPHLHNTKTKTKKKVKKKKKIKQQIRSKRTSTPDPASPSPSPSSPSPSHSPFRSEARTDATVIDTSTPGWKSCKLLIRKGSVWKIRDKKQCSAAFSKRKRLVHAANNKQLLESHNPPLPLDQGENHEESIDATEVPVKRPRLSKLPSVPEAAKSIALHLKVRTNVKKKGLASSISLKENVQY